MQNLAGHKEASDRAKAELETAGIDVFTLPEPQDHEVRSRFGGRLGPFLFTRKWYYWSVRGPMPKAQARRMYEDAIGRTDVRVDGHCGCPSPDEWCEGDTVDLYHVDSVAGLRLIADTIRSIPTVQKSTRTA